MKSVIEGRQRRDSYRHHEEEEPEWFSEGPTSQNDRIELHGFEGPKEVTEDRSKGKGEDEEEDNNMDTGFDEEYHEEHDEAEEKDTSTAKSKCVTVLKRSFH